MSLQYFIILLSIWCRATGQAANVTFVNETESAGVTNNTSESAPESAEVTNMTSESPRGTGLPGHPCSNSIQWQCADNKDCIEIDQKCDGVFHCEDASDETLETCRNEKPRPLFGLILHCSSFWNHQRESVCPQICQKSPEFCYYALAAENNESNTCLLPDYPINGAYKIMPLDQTEMTGQVDFWLNFTCEAPYVMVQKKLLQCINGTWDNDDPAHNGYCSEACQLNKHSNFTYKCPMDVYSSTKCGDYVAIETTVNVAHAFHEEDNPAKNVSVDILCAKDKQFDISTDCVQKVDAMQQDFENPTMVKMTDYESKFNQYKGNETNKDFMNLVDEYHEFEGHVRGNLTLMWTMAEKCDISLDFLLYNLQQNEDKKKQDY